MATSHHYGKKKQLQETQRPPNLMLLYLLPFLVGLVTGCTLMLLAQHLLCWVPGVWACPLPQEQAKVLLQVAPSPVPSLHTLVPPTLVAQRKKEEDPEKDQLPPSLAFPPRHHHRDPTPNTTAPHPAPSCPSRPLHLVILVLSAPGASLRRTAIRGTWAHDYRSRVVRATTRFLVGTRDLEPARTNNILKEQEMFGDLLILESLRDSYANLSTKVLLGLRWADRSLEYDFLVKVDDDSYVRVEGISNALHKLDCDPRLYWGYFMGHAYPEAVGKWAEQNWFQCPHYLPYAMGGGYVVSQRTVRALMQVSGRLVLYNNEDVTVGSWLAPLHLNRRHDVRFNVESLSHGCNNGYLISHKERVRTFYIKYTSLIKNGTLCEQEKETHPAYIYNWTASPLDCCHRIKGLPIT